MLEHKNFCPIHHLYFRGLQCPLCEKERLNKMVEKFEKKTESTSIPVNENREINEDDLMKLVSKFNVK